MQEVTGGAVEVAFVDQGYTGEAPAEDVRTNGIRLEVVKHTEAKKGVRAAADGPITTADARIELKELDPTVQVH